MADDTAGIDVRSGSLSDITVGKRYVGFVPTADMHPMCRSQRISPLLNAQDRIGIGQGLPVTPNKSNYRPWLKLILQKSRCKGLKPGMLGASGIASRNSVLSPHWHDSPGPRGKQVKGRNRIDFSGMNLSDVNISKAYAEGLH